MIPTGGWVKESISGKPSRESHRDALALENERIAEYHRELRREFLERDERRRTEREAAA
jgi:hypothetical protein